MLAGFWRAEVLEKAFLAGAGGDIVLSGLSEAQIMIWSAPHRVRVIFVLAVILPEANGANIVPTPFPQSQKAATWALVGNSLDTGFDYIDERLTHERNSFS
jgi:hypothetical protein